MNTYLFIQTEQILNHKVENKRNFSLIELVYTVLILKKTKTRYMK